VLRPKYNVKLKRYVLPDMCTKVLCNSDTMHEKCIILRFEIVVFAVMVLCNINGQH